MKLFVYIISLLYINYQQKHISMISEMKHCVGSNWFATTIKIANFFWNRVQSMNIHRYCMSSSILLKHLFRLRVKGKKPIDIINEFEKATAEFWFKRGPLLHNTLTNIKSLRIWEWEGEKKKEQNKKAYRLILLWLNSINSVCVL